MQALILTGLLRSATVASFTDGFARVTNDDSLLAGSAQSEGRTCLVPRPPTPRSFVFGSRGPSRSSGYVTENQLTAKAWEKAVQELGKGGTLCVWGEGRGS